MSVAGQSGMRNGLSPALMLSIAVVALALPSAVLAFTSSFDVRHETLATRSNISTFTPASVDPRFARTIAMHNVGHGQLFRFTPAGTSTRPNRSVTVAVRVDPKSAQVISVQRGTGDAQLAAVSGALRLAPSAYSLGVSRGYQSFTLPSELRKNENPDLASFRLRTGAPDEPSRLNARIAFDEREKTGRAPRTLEANGDQIVDVGGSFRVTRNIDLTAGVRYSQERDRLLPQIDGAKDSQAVYVGTQFRF